MDFALSEQQEMLKKSAFDFLTKECTKKLVREMEQDEKGYSPDLWHKMADLGWIGLVFPEQYGGGGLSYVELTTLEQRLMTKMHRKLASWASCTPTSTSSC